MPPKPDRRTMPANPEHATPPDPTRIMQLSTAYWASQTLLTANRLGVFDALADGPLTAAEAANRLHLDPRMTALFLNACVGIGLCDKDGERYANSAASAFFLASGGPAPMHNSIRFMDDLYPTWGRLEEALKTGEPVRTAATYLGTDEAQTRHFVHSMHERALAIGRSLPDVVDLSGRRRMLDVGGGPGTFSALLTARYPGLKAEVLELTGVADVAEDLLAATGAAERVSMRRGDYHTSAFGEGYDVVLMCGMFHRESEQSCRRLVAKAQASLLPGGLLVVSDVFADAGGATPEFAALFGITMMLTAPDGGMHADADVADWLREAGFASVERRPFPPPMPHRVVTGVRA